jgi:TonB family protein
VPMPSAVFDTARLNQHVAGRAAGSIVLAWAPPDTNWRESFGPRPDSMAIIESTLTDAEGTDVRDALLTTLNRPVTIPLLLRIDFTDRPRLRVAPALVCRPAVLRGADLQRYETTLRSLSRGSHRATVGLVVRPDGSVTEARLRTSSGNSQFDASAVDAVSLLHFRPGLLNRVPIPVFVAFPVEIR